MRSIETEYEEVFVIGNALLVDIQLGGCAPERAEIHDDEGTGNVLVVTADRVPISVTRTTPAVSTGVDQKFTVLQ
jgi:hypothetical protein